MRRILFILVILMLWRCGNPSVNPDDLHYLNGYWEISEVEFPNGAIKEYGINPTIDFIQIEDGKGFRKKLKPQFDGTYDTSKDVESLSTATTNGSILLRYSTPLSEWEEKLVRLDSLSFSVVNEEGVTYRYNRFEPIKIPQ
ncbi:MAG: hypothetical protein JJ876_13860 [Muricauda sp.]|nr:hypothetical protein [Allomuricauda sp.]MBO6830632.1 hypothetical protein [Allomuricauda sp.]